MVNDAGWMSAYAIILAQLVDSLQPLVYNSRGRLQSRPRPERTCAMKLPITCRLILATTLLVLLAIPLAADTFTFVHMSDIHINSSADPAKNAKAAIAEINAMNPKPAFVIVSGDLTEMGFADDYARYKAVISELQMPAYNAMGNHEVKWSDWGKAGPRRFLNQEPYYSFDHGGIHFVALDTTMWLEHNGFMDQSQLTWLKKDLDKVGKLRPVVLFYHHGPGFLPNELSLLKTISPYNVRCILLGHGHTFVTYTRNGITMQMAQSPLQAPGAYRILEVSDNEISSYRKLVGQPKTADGVISLARQTNPVTLIEPSNGAKIEGPIRFRARIMPGAPVITKLAYGIGKEYFECKPGADGTIDVTHSWTGGEGWKTVSIRATDSTGMEWYDSALVRINGAKREVWRMQATGAIQRPMTVKGPRLYFGTWGGDVYCLNAGSGRTIWRTSLKSDVISQIAVDAARAYMGTGDGRIIALDALRGRKLWEYRTAGPIQASAIVVNGVVYVGSGDHNMYALNAATGKLCWKYDTTRLIQVKPVYLDGAILFGSWDQNFYSLDAKDGSLRWKTHIGELIYFSPANSDPATDGSRIIVTAQAWHKGEPNLFCLDPKTGAILWKCRNPGDKGQVCFSNPMIQGNRFVVGSLSGRVFSMNTSDASEVWHADTGQEAYENSPIFSGNHVLHCGLSGGVYCFDAATGNQLWKYSAGEGYLFASPSVWGNLVIVPSTDGTVTAIRDDAK